MDGLCDCDALSDCVSDGVWVTEEDPEPVAEMLGLCDGVADRLGVPLPVCDAVIDGDADTDGELEMLRVPLPEPVSLGVEVPLSVCVPLGDRVALPEPLRVPDSLPLPEIEGLCVRDGEPEPVGVGVPACEAVAMPLGEPLLLRVAVPECSCDGLTVPVRDPDGVPVKDDEPDRDSAWERVPERVCDGLPVREGDCEAVSEDDVDAELLRDPVELGVPDNDADADPLGVTVDDGDPVGEPDELGDVL